MRPGAPSRAPERAVSDPGRELPAPVFPDHWEPEGLVLDFTSYRMYTSGDEPGYRVDFYTTAEGDNPVRDFLRRLDGKHRAKIGRWIDRLEKEGPDLPRPYADVLEGNIRELRIALSHHQYRLLYFFHGRTAVFVNAFLKKTPRVPPDEIGRALRRMIDWMKRHRDA